MKLPMKVSATRLIFIGDMPGGSLCASAYTIIENGATNLWYEINDNHRPAWVPASEVTAVQTKA